jgi:raffinose/stachyose/melibiose transport system substrate-binding protein
MKMMKIAIVLLFATCLAGNVFAGGGGQQQGGGGSAQSGTKGRSLSIAVMAQADAENQVLVKKYYTDPIKAAFPNDTITFVEWTDRQSIQIQVAGGGGPDILDLDGPTDAVEFAKAGRVIDLTPYAQKFGWSTEFFEWAYNSGYYNSKLYSLPNSFEGMVIYYNLDIFKKYNVALPTTAAELVAANQTFQKNGIIPISFGNSNYQGAVDWLYSIWTSCYAGPAKVRDVLTGKIKWDDPLLAGSWQQMIDWWQAGYIGDKKSQAITNDDMVALFANGQAAMMVDGTWAAGGLLNVYPNCNWEIALMPELRPGVGRYFPLATGGAYAINSACADKDFAVEVLNWIFDSKDRHIANVKDGNGQPYPLKYFNKDSFTGMDPRMVAMYNVLMDAQNSGNTGYCSWTFYPSDLRVYMNENTDALFLGRLTLRDFLARCQEITDTAIKNGTVPPIH